MTPAARLAAAIEVLDLMAGSKLPADRVLYNYVRTRRYIGSKDREAVGSRVYGVLRRRARLGWWLDRAFPGGVPDGRFLIAADLLLGDGLTLDELDRLAAAGKHAPKALGPGERRSFARLAGHTLEHPEMPEAVRLECPTWMEADLRAVLGADFAAEMTALIEEAPVDLRVNTLVEPSRDALRARLQRAGVDAKPTVFSPVGLRLARRRPIDQLPDFKSGAIEVQDEGSQLVALLVGAVPGARVVDYCAGAGGKTLAMAAQMANKGRLVAMDIAGGRLDRAALRLRRAHVHNVERRALASDNDRWVKRHAGGFDRVLVDAPCSGTGTWRRNPDARWRFGPDDLKETLTRQSRILDSAARLVAPGGRLVYATCAIGRAENEDQVARLLESRSEFRLVPVAEAWRDTVAQLGGGACPADGPMMRLTPRRHGTDGFFAAVLERRPA